MDYFWQVDVRAAIDRKRRLKALLSFANVDFEQWSRWNHERRLRNWQRFGRAIFGLELEPTKHCPVGKEALEIHMEYFQPRDSFLPGRMNTVSSEVLTSEEGVQALSRYQRIAREVLDSLINHGDDPLGESFYLNSCIMHVDINRSGVLNVSVYPTGNPDAVIRCALLMLLNGVKVNQLHRCEREGCGRYFEGRVNAKYCSRKCADAVAHRRFRSQRSEEYKLYMKELMRDQYREACGLKPRNKWRGGIVNIHERLEGKNNGSKG